METEERIQYVIEHTEIVRPPKQTLATFGITNIHYYLVTEPVYSELLENSEETVVREGRVIAERPKIVTPYYLLNLFEGFEHGKEYAEYMLNKYGLHEPGLLYRYKNEPMEINILSSSCESVVDNLNKKIDSDENTLAAIIKGVDEMWDISLMKFIHDLTRGSLRSNVMEIGMKGFLDVDRSGIPNYTRHTIEQLFREARIDQRKATELETELRRWGLFDEYEDRFLALFRKR
jgi:hypothetical protein